MKQRFLVTGANGHLGSTLLRLLQSHPARPRLSGLLLPGQQPLLKGDIDYVYGDVRDLHSLLPLFTADSDCDLYVLHTAGVVDISDTRLPLLRAVNVQGTKNILALCQRYAVKRLLYVSSVHAVPELPQGRVQQEVENFSPDWVYGAYAKSKAEATQAVLEAARQGLDAVVVQPSGILGPYDATGNHLVQLVRQYVQGRLPACVKGAYDFVDVRDVAQGCLLAMEKGRRGHCYILSNQRYEIPELLALLRDITGGRRLPVLPLWLARAAVPLLQWQAQRRQSLPLFTAYSLYTLRSNSRFSHDKATAELGYRPRELYHTLRDTVDWLRGEALPV